MDEWITLADASGRNIPILWVGPTAAAAGHHHQTQGDEGARWQYTLETAREAEGRQVEALGMYNLSLQANGWGGSPYGQRVGLVQAMMVTFIDSGYKDGSTANDEILGDQLAVEGGVDLKGIHT